MPPDAAAGNPLLQLPIIPYLLIFGIFYFLILRPQQAEKKKLKDLIANVKKNDEVVTAGGIHGTVVIIKDKTVVVRIDDNARMEIDKEAISSVKTG